MIQRTLAQMAEMITVENDLSAFAKTEVTGVCIDSRKIAPGNLFVPFKGEKADGHKYVEQAIGQGAAAALWQSDVPNPPEHLPLLIVEDTLIALQELARSYRKELPVKVVGITGSNGKTTTKDITANLLSLKYKVQKTEGNFNNEIGLPLTVLGLDEDTDIAVLEMGMSSRGEIDFLTKLAKPSAVIITNIGESHLLDLGSREGITEAKLEIIAGLEEGGLIVYFGDEPLLKNRLTDYRGNGLVKTFGRTQNNDLYPSLIRQTDNGNQFTINGVNEQFSLPVLGGHNILNALAAMLVADYFKVPFAEMNAGFANLKLTQMRTELVEGINGGKIINDAYNASPTSMNAAIELISHLSGYQKKILVLGDMLELGPQEEEFHERIGQSLNGDKINLLFTFGRLGGKIAEGARTVLAKEHIFTFDEKKELIEQLKQHIDEHTLILVKASRGMKLEEVVSALQAEKA
jgi:UDP-N-acetylmuramoyl-tripeptide--D-alanyl-D-alanine ligase